jgi:hypothetical protein
MIPMVIGVVSLVAIIWLIGKNKRKKIREQ